MSEAIELQSLRGHTGRSSVDLTDVERATTSGFGKLQGDEPLPEVAIESNDGGSERTVDSDQQLQPQDQEDQEELDYPDGGWRAYTVTIGSFLGLTANFGLLNSVGAIQTYLSTHQLAGYSASTISWIFSIYLSLAFAVTIFVGPYFDAKGTLKPMLAGTVLFFAGLMATANCTTIWQFILAFSLCVGIGNSLCISPLIGVFSHWFNHRIGLAVGLGSMGGSLGGIAVPLMLRSFYEKYGFAWAIRILAFFCLGLNLLATFLIKERFKEVPQNRHGLTKKEAIIEKSRQYFDYSAVKELDFIFLVLAVFLGETCLLSIVTYIGSYAIVQGFSESQSYILLTIFSAMGIPGRAVPGYLSDKIGRFNVMVLMLLGSSLSIFIVWLPFGGNHALLYLFVILSGFFSASIFSLTPVCLRQITPVRVFGSRYGLMYFFVSLGNLFGIPVASAIIGDSSKFHYNMFALFCGLISSASTLFWIFCRYKAVGFRIAVKV